MHKTGASMADRMNYAPIRQKTVAKIGFQAYDKIWNSQNRD